MAAELHAEIAQLRSELESTRAVAARLAGAAARRRRTDHSGLVPVRRPGDLGTDERAVQRDGQPRGDQTGRSSPRTARRQLTGLSTLSPGR